MYFKHFIFLALGPIRSIELNSIATISVEQVA